MNDLVTLQKLLTVSEVKYDQQRQALSKLLQEEYRLRNELIRLSEMGRTAQQQTKTTAVMQAIGADLLWQGWLGRARAEQNMKLARVLARKEHEKGKVRQAFGKVAAVRELINQAQQTQRKAAARKDLNLAIGNAIK